MQLWLYSKVTKFKLYLEMELHFFHLNPQKFCFDFKVTHFFSRCDIKHHILKPQNKNKGNWLRILCNFIQTRNSFGEKACRTQKNFDHKQCKYCQMNHSIPTAVSSWRLSGVHVVWNTELSTLLYWKKKNGVWEVQGTKMTTPPQHRNRAARFSFCHTWAYPCSCVHSSLVSVCLMWLPLLDEPTWKKNCNLQNFSIHLLHGKECRGWKIFTAVASKWIDTNGILNHHIHSPCHREEVQKTRCLLSYMKMTGH